MTGDDFRQFALSLPGVEEKSHFGNPDFRVAGKIFATLAFEAKGFGVLSLTPEEQARLIADAPDLFSPVPGGWGKKGSTLVRLDAVPPDILAAALRVAWERKRKVQRRGTAR